MKIASYDGTSVFVTGHTGFKGGWLSIWLAQLGAKVTGYSLPPCTEPNLFELAKVQRVLTGHHFSDIRDLPALTAAMRSAEPEIVFHLAAQPLVRSSYSSPVETWATNVMGTVNLLEAVRACPSARAVVVVTTDKCYENKEWCWGYREIDRLGGHDPYSASKASTELVTESYRQSFFDQQNVCVATARAGNVIGGGDWSEDRLLPDAARAIARKEALMIRNPESTRPWQHVLESLHGYLLLGQKLLAGDRQFATAFNFGSDAADNLPVQEMLRRLQRHWPGLTWVSNTASAATGPHEAALLSLDSSKAKAMLGWQPIWHLPDTLAKTAQWYRAVSENQASARAVTEQQLSEFCS